MKTKELIARLQEVDPSGEIEVCVNNQSVSFVEVCPAYWDGPLQVVDKNSARYQARGEKLRIHYRGVKKLLEDNPYASVDYSDLSEDSAQVIGRNDHLKRIAILAMEFELRLEDFIRWLKTEHDRDLCPKDLVFFHKYLAHREYRTGETSENEAMIKDWEENICLASDVLQWTG